MASSQRDPSWPQDIRCPGCGLILPGSTDGIDTEFNASAACRQLMYQLSYYTLSLRDPAFIHQLTVDAYAAQHAGPEVKPITTAFALVGLYLVWERGFTGRQVQVAHTALARSPRRRQPWPRFSPPHTRAALTVQHPVAADESEKQAAIREWSRSVWETWRPEESRIAALLLD